MSGDGLPHRSFSYSTASLHPDTSPPRTTNVLPDLPELSRSSILNQVDKLRDAVMISYNKMHLKKFVKQRPPRSKNRTFSRLKIFLGVFVCVVLAVILYWDSIVFHSGGDISCFHEPGNLLVELNPDEPLLGSSIFFHETSCRESCSDIHLNARQACSVESALLTHPEKNVFLLVTSPVRVPLMSSKNPLIQELLGYRNLKVRHISFSKYLSDTPMTVIDQSGALNFSQWPVSHASDVLRYATLYKFGGIYLDLDVIVLKSLGKLVNFAGAESDASVGSGILGFGSDAIGREVASECAEELARTFNGQVWGYNGPGVITRVLKRRCQTSSVVNMTKKNCQGFDVHPMASFTAISFTEVELFFAEDEKQTVPKLLNRSYTVHFWNKFSSSFPLKNHLNVPFVNYARKFCPKVFERVNGSF